MAEIDLRDLMVDDIFSLDPVTGEEFPFDPDGGGERPPHGLWDDEEPPYPPEAYIPEVIERGGAGSGHFGHEGRPGQRGGSQPGDFHSAKASEKKRGGRKSELYGGIELVGAFPDDVLEGVKRGIDFIPLHLRPALRRIFYKRDWDRISHIPGSKEVWIGAGDHMLADKDGSTTAFDGKAIVTQAQLEYEKKQKQKGNQSWYDPKRVIVDSLRGYHIERAVPHEIGHAVHDVLPKAMLDRTWKILKRYGNKIQTHSTRSYEDYFYGPESLYNSVEGGVGFADLPDAVVARRMMREQYAEGFRLWATKDPQFRKLPADLRKIYTDLNRAEVSTESLTVFRGGPGSGHFGHAGRPGEVGGSAPGDFHSGKSPRVPHGDPDAKQVTGGKWNPEADLLYHWTDRDGIQAIVDSLRWDAGSLTANPAYRFDEGWGGGTRRWAVVLDRSKVSEEPAPQTVPWEEWEVISKDDAELMPGLDEESAFAGFGVRTQRDANQLRNMLAKTYGDDWRQMFPVHLVGNVKPARLRNLVQRGGEGSGHFGHSGRPGEVGGSDAGDFHPGKGKKVSTASKDTSAKEFKPAGSKAVKAPISIAPKLTIGEQDEKPKPVEQFDDGSAIVEGRRSWLSEQELNRTDQEAGAGFQATEDAKILKATVATDQNMTKDDWDRWDRLRQAMTGKYDAIVDEFQGVPVNKALDAMRPRYEQAAQMLQEVNDRLEEELAKPSPDPNTVHQYRKDMARITDSHLVFATEAMEAFGSDLADVTESLASAGAPTFDGKEIPGDDANLRAQAQTSRTGGDKYAAEGYERAVESVGMVKGVLARFANPAVLKVSGFSIRPPDPLQGMGFSRSRNYMAIEADATPGEVAHEYGHAMSDSNPKVGDLAKMFLLYRTQGDASIPYRGDPNIQVKPDAFISEYSGRFYAHRDERRPVSGEEVFSMGLQFLTTNPAEFARRDPEHMAFTLALLAGDWEKAEAVARGLSFSPLVKRLLPAGGWQDAAQRLGEALGLVQAPEKPAPVVRPVPAPQEGTADLLGLPTGLHGSGIWGTAYTTEEAARLAQDVLARQTEDVRKALAKAETDLTAGEVSKEDKKLDAGARKRARDRIEKQMLRYGEKQDQPEAVLLAGLPGSGKTTLLNNRAHEFRGYVRLSADDVRSRMPNYEGWNSPLLADEADDVLERVMTKAVKEHRPVVLDSMLKTGDTAERIVKALGAHGYRTRVIFVDTPMETAMERAISRYTSGTGRYVSPAYIASHADKGLHTFERLKSVADTWEHWTNDGEAPKKLAEGKRNA